MLFFEILIGLSFLKMVVCIVLYLFNKPSDPPGGVGDEGGLSPSADILLPMYNEEKVVVSTIHNLLNIAGPGTSVIVVDDGSTDKSYEVVQAHFSGHPQVRLVHQPNGGKSSALNRAMGVSESDIIVCIDADTMVKPDAMERILPYFRDEKVAAVAGYIKVGNRVNLLTDMQYAEYLTIQGLDRILFGPLNGILVVPGALGAFRRTAVKAVGGFTAEALAEDCDITLRLLCEGYTIKNAASAFSFTEAPATAKMFCKQRVRWTVGLLQGLLKHHRRLMGQPNKALAWLVLPFTWLYRVILPLFTPFADLYFVYACLFLHQYDCWKYYGLFLLTEALPAGVILLWRGERMNWVKGTALQLLYRQLGLITYLSIVLRWCKGNLYGWSKIPREGSVKMD